MVGNVQRSGGSGVLIDLDGKGMFSLVDDEIDVVCFGECNNFHVVSVGTSFGHPGQVSFEGGIEVGGRDCRGIEFGCECTSILSLWIPSSATARVGLDEALVVVPVGSHVLNDGVPDLAMLGLISVELVGKSMKETITCSWDRDQHAAKVRKVWGGVRYHCQRCRRGKVRRR